MTLENTLAYYEITNIIPVISFIFQAPKACTIKHYGLVIYRFRNKLTCLSKLVCFVTGDRKTLAYYEICQFALMNESAMFDSTGPRSHSHFHPSLLFSITAETV